MKIGFTGTQWGMTSKQEYTLYEIIHRLFPTESHSGDCIGADKEFLNAIRHLKPKCKTFGHPPKNSKKRAFCKYDSSFPEEEYLIRNRNIVNNSDLLIATPREFKEELRSGTWATIRYARKIKKPIIIIFPDGSYKKEEKQYGM